MVWTPLADPETDTDAVAEAATVPPPRRLLPPSRPCFEPAQRPPLTGITPNVLILRSLPLLRDLPDPMLAYLARRARIQSFARGHCILAQGEQRELLLLLLSGKAYATRRGANGREVLLDVLTHGSHFGEMSLLDGQPHTASLRCQSACKVLAVPGADFLQGLAQSPELSQALVLSLVRRMRANNRRIALMALKDVRARVLAHLHDCSAPHDGQWRLNAPLVRTELAYQVGASREMVSRIVNQFQRDGTLVAGADGALCLTCECPAV